MKPVELTLFRSLKVLWSFIWRVWILSVPLGLIAMVIGYASFHFPSALEMMHPQEFISIPGFMLLWLVMMIGGIFVHIFAMKLALKAHWSDFRISIVPPPSHRPPQPEETDIGANI